jgi:hypothetical protein
LHILGFSPQYGKKLVELSDFQKSRLTAEEQRALYAEQVKQLYNNALLGLLATSINSLILTIIQRDVTSPATLIAWLVLLALVSVVGYRDIRAFWRRAPEPPEIDSWGMRFILRLALSGMA